MLLYAVDDLASAFSKVRSWGYLASKQLQFDYRSSFIGSSWTVISFLLTSIGIGVLMAQLQARPVESHLPYVMFGFAAWNFINNMITGGCDVLRNAKPYLHQIPLARSVFVLSLTLRNFFLLGLQLSCGAIVASFFGWRPNLLMVWVVPAIFVYAAAGFGAALLLGHLCARIPDLSPLVTAVMRLAFFFTPIIWIPGSSSRSDAEGLIGVLMHWNPFTHMLHALRDGMLGLPPSALHWTVALALTIVLLLTGIIALQILGRRITYWL